LTLLRLSHQEAHWGGRETYSKGTDSAHWYVSLPFWVPWTSVQSVWFGSGCFQNNLCRPDFVELAHGVYFKYCSCWGSRVSSNWARKTQQVEQSPSVDPGERSEPLAVLTRLAKQNQGLDTSGWRLLHRQQKPEGQLLVFAVCDASLRVLRSLGGRAHLELAGWLLSYPAKGRMALLRVRRGQNH